jgi:hypothetical protein
VILVACIAAGCGGGRVASPPPASPIAAPADPPDRPAAEVCGALVTDLERYQVCVPEDRKELIDAWLERARIDIAALGADGVTKADRRDSARACAKASDAIRAALATCPTPP